MFGENIDKLERKKTMQKNVHYDKIQEIETQNALRFADMQQVVNAKLMASQASVDNAQNYPSTWSTNPDGGSNGQV